MTGGGSMNPIQRMMIRGGARFGAWYGRKLMEFWLNTLPDKPGLARLLGFISIIVINPITLLIVLVLANQR